MQNINRLWIMNVLRAITLLWLIIHFTLTLIYTLPKNPMRDTLEPLLHATIGTYFPQDWKLFAPDPVSSDFALLVRPLNRGEFEMSQTLGLPTDGWYDLSTPLWTKFQNNRFSAYNRISRPVEQAISHYLEQPSQQPIQLMVKIASAFCKDIGQNDASYVALVIRESQSKPWSERGTSEHPTVKTMLVGIYPVDKRVKEIHLYQIEENNEYIP